MSQSKNRHQAERWLATAEEDLRAAEVLSQSAMHAQACFLAQQSGEKALKSIWYLSDLDPWGHSVQRLIVDFPSRDEVPELKVWLEQAALLDKYYIPTRYPNGLPDLTPGQVYGETDAARGLQAARFLLNRCRQWIDSH